MDKEPQLELYRLPAEHAKIRIQRHAYLLEIINM